jgi:hypothetical protein
LALKRVRLELARSPEHPDGSSNHGYEFVLPLTPDGQLDRADWERAPELCTVHRFWEGEEDETGQLVHAGKGKWAFSYRGGEEDDEPIHRFADHLFKEGEYVSVREHDGRSYAFRIVLVANPPGFQKAHPA